MTDFNFTLGSRWQSKGAGAGTVYRWHPEEKDSFELTFSDGSAWWYRMGDNGDESLVPPKYQITGPADPQAPGMIDGERQGDDEQRFWDAAAVAALQGMLAASNVSKFDVKELATSCQKTAEALLAARRQRATRDAGGE